MKIFTAILLLLTSCAGLQQHVLIAPETDMQHCRELDFDYRAWGGTGIGAGIMSGALAAAGSRMSDEGWQLALGLGSAGLSTLATVALFMTKDISNDYGKQCEDLGDVGIAEFPETTETSTVVELHF